MKSNLFILIALLIMYSGTAFAAEPSFDGCRATEMSVPLTEEEEAIALVKDRIKENMRLDWQLLDIYSEKQTSEGQYEIIVIIVSGTQRIKGVVYATSEEIIYDFLGSKTQWHRAFFEYKSKAQPKKE